MLRRALPGNPVPLDGTAGSPAAGGSSVAVAPAMAISSDANGRTLYEFDQDTLARQQRLHRRRLRDQLARAHPRSRTEVTLGTGLDAEDFTTFVRDRRSSTQIAYYGKPLYYFAGDTAAGDTNGASVSASWHLAKPQ